MTAYRSLMTAAHATAKQIRQAGESYAEAFAVALRAAWMALKESEMSETTSPTALACEIALGLRRPDPSEAALSIRAAHKDLNCKGRGPWWYRMVLRDGSWQYFAEERLPMGTFLASDRRATVRGDVYLGELVIDHDKGGPVDQVYLVTGGKDRVTACEFSKRRDGMLAVTLPDGREVVVTNPRR